jgi:hypothetical protein
VVGVEALNADLLEAGEELADAAVSPGRPPATSSATIELCSWTSE